MNSAFTGNDSSPRGNEYHTTQSHKVKGIGNVRSAALKRITGAGKVGAKVDQADESRWPIQHSGKPFVGSKGSAKRNSLKPSNKNAVPSDPRTS